MKIYEGSRDTGGVIVTVNGRHLPIRLDLFNHSPNGFEWGYAGSGPAQLALAILADCLGDEEALRWYQDFKFAVVARMPFEWWSVTEEEIRADVADAERKAANE